MKQIKKYRHVILAVFAGVMAAATVFTIIQMIFFVGENLDRSLNVSPAPAPVTQFDTQGFDQLHLVQPGQ